MPPQKQGAANVPPAPQLGLNIHPPSASDDEPVNLADVKTTKQVHREYLARTRITKEESRRLEAELREEERRDRERQRKEAEKAKASSRARYLREKKKAKEEEERREKRTQGLPTVAVHPSQATISWFARGAATKRSIGQTEDAEEGANPPKRTQVKHPEQQPSTTMASIEPRGMELLPSEALPSPTQVATLEPANDTRYLLEHATDLFPSNSQVQRELDEEWAPVKPPSPPGRLRAPPNPKPTRPNPQAKSQAKSQSLQKLGGQSLTARELKRLSQLDQGLDAMLQRQPRRAAAGQDLDDMLSRERKRQHERERRCQQQKPLPKPASKPTPKPASLAQQLGSMAAAPVAAATRMVNRIKNSFPLFSPQDLVLSSQDVREIEGTVTTKPKSPAAKMVDRIKNLLNQDLVMSSQDIREIEVPTSKSQPQLPSSSKPRPSQKHDGQLAPPQKGPVGTSIDESDYDDDILDDAEAAVELLEKVESRAATPALNDTTQAAALPAAPEVADVRQPTGDSAVLVEDLLGNGDWLSDDDKLGV